EDAVSLNELGIDWPVSDPFVQPSAGEINFGMGFDVLAQTQMQFPALCRTGLLGSGMIHEFDLLHTQTLQKRRRCEHAIDVIAEAHHRYAAEVEIDIF